MLQHLRYAALVAALATFAGSPARAQTGNEAAPRLDPAFEVRPLVGVYIPTGDQSDIVKSAVLTGVQLSYAVIPHFAVTGTFAWSPTKDKVTAGNETVDLFQYDLGVEGRLPKTVGTGKWVISPFIGAGLGGRTYDYRDLDASSETTFAGYGALGADFWAGRYGFRIEGRDFISNFKGLSGGQSGETRNDIGVFGTLTMRF